MTTALPTPPTDLTAIPSVAAVLGQITDLEQFAATYKVTTVEQFTAGADDLKRVKTAQDSLETERRKITDPLNQAVKATNNLFRTPSERLVAIEGIVKKALRAFDEEQERKAAAERRRLEEEAQRERDRLAREARERQAEADRKAREERERAAAERAAGNTAEAEKLERKAEGIEQRATERVETLQERAQSVVAPSVVAAKPKVAGLSRRDNWKYEIKDAGKIPSTFKIPDERKIADLVKAMKLDALSLLGGPDAVRIWNDQSFGSAKS